MVKLRLLLVFSLVLLALGHSERLARTWAPGSTSSADTQAPPKKPVKAGEQRPEEDRPQGKTGISVAVDLVSLYALVTDKKGNIITGLQPEHFTLYEDNVKQEIASFAVAETNMTVVMLVEYSRQVSYFVLEVWDAIYGFAATLRPDDWVAVIGYDMRPTVLCDFTQDRNELQDTLRRFNYPAFSESNLCDALIYTLDRVQETEGKVAIFLVSTGLDTFSKHTYDEALKKAKESKASVFALSLGQNFRIRAEAAGYITGPLSTELLMADNRLRSFAEFTGGEAFYPRFVTEFPSIFQNISNILRNQYSLAYVSSNTKRDGKYRKIKVEVNVDVNRDGKPDELKIFTRKGYQSKES